MRFDFAFSAFARASLLPFGIMPGNSWLELDRDTLGVSFGPFGMETPTSNLVGYQVSGDYKWYRAIGLRLSLRDGGITFGTNTRRGLCVLFENPIDQVVPVAKGPHRGMTVTVADVDGLAAALEQHGVPRRTA